MLDFDDATDIEIYRTSPIGSRHVKCREVGSEENWVEESSHQASQEHGGFTAPVVNHM